MRKNKVTILSLALFSALLFAGAAGLCTQKSPLTASAESSPPVLISPSDYEQYLSLTAPTAVAATDDYTAIADGKVLHVYDRSANLYREYTHSDDITQIAFDHAGNLYFLSELVLQTISASTLANPTPIDGISCLGFTLHNDTLYYVTPTKLKSYSFTDGTSTDYPLPNNAQAESVLTFAKGNLYCVCESANGYTVYEIDPDSKNVKPLAEFPERLSAIAIANNLLCAVTKSGDFRSYNLSNLNVPLTDTAADETDKGGYTALYAKKKFDNCKTVFIAPCASKKAEGAADENVDYVWTFRDLDAVIQGFGIDIESTMPYTPTEVASRDAHNFAKTTGVFNAVKNHIGDENLEGVVIADLNKKNIAMLKGFAKTGKCPGKLVEVMSCPGGCITGPCACSQGGEAARRFEAEVKKK